MNNTNVLFLGDDHVENAVDAEDYFLDKNGNPNKKIHVRRVIWQITQNNKREFRKTVSKLAKIHEVHDEGTTWSDAALSEITYESPYLYINLVTKPPKVKRLVKAEFFKYFHNLPIDLSRYQIYRKDQIEEINYEPCLIYSLRMAGLDEILINKAKKYVKIDMIPLKTVKKVASKINVAINIYDSDKNHYYKYNSEAKIKITINLNDEHYFIDDSETGITNYALSHLNELKNIDNFNNIYGINKKGYYQRTEDRYMNSNKLVKFLLNNKEKYLTEILDELEIKNRHKEELEEDLEYDDEECKLNEYQERKDISNKDLIFFDFETTTDESIHKPYLIHANKFKMIGDEYVSIVDKTFYGDECGLKFLKWINNDSILLAHNLKYDYRFITIKGLIYDAYIFITYHLKFIR